MPAKDFLFSYEAFPSIADLPTEDKSLFDEAVQHLHHSYSPYSQFKVVATLRLSNGKLVTGTNQENAAYTVCICAERVALAAVASMHPDEYITTIAVSYQNAEGKSLDVVSPCGVCRQALVEVEGKQGKPIRILFGGFQGQIIALPSTRLLLPFAFDKNFLS